MPARIHGIRGSLLAVKTTFTTDEANELINGSQMRAPTSDDVCVWANRPKDREALPELRRLAEAGRAAHQRHQNRNAER